MGDASANAVGERGESECVDRGRLAKGKMRRTSAQVTEAIVAVIKAGTDPAFQPGKPIPSGRALAERLGASLMTVQKAIRQLVEDGVLIEGHRRFEVRALPLGRSRAFYRLPDDDLLRDAMDYWYLRGIVVGLAVYFFQHRLPDVTDILNEIGSETRSDIGPPDVVKRRYQLIDALVSRLETAVDTPFVVNLLQRARGHYHRRAEAVLLEIVKPGSEGRWFWTKRALEELLHEMQRAPIDPPMYQMLRCDHIAKLVKDLLFSGWSFDFPTDRKRRDERDAIWDKEAREHYRRYRKGRRGWTVAGLAGELRDRIIKGHGDWLPGAFAPSGRTLEREFEVSRVTMQAARQQLVAYGWLVPSGSRLRVGPEVLWVDREEFAATPFRAEARDLDVLFKLAAEIAYVIQLRLADMHSHQRDRLPGFLLTADLQPDLSFQRENLAPGLVTWAAVQRVYGIMALDGYAPLHREALVHVLDFLGDRLSGPMASLEWAFNFRVAGIGSELAYHFEHTPRYVFGSDEGPRRRLFRLEDIAVTLKTALASVDRDPTVSWGDASGDTESE